MATATAKKLDIDLPAEIFDVQTNVPLIHQVVVAQLAAARQGTHSTKTRGEVRGGGRKPHRQKGTGRARQGSTRAPQFAGGGVVHGPQPRDYSQRTPKKMKAAALRGALSDRARHDRIHIVQALVAGESPSTKDALALLAGLTERPNLLVVLDRTDTVSMKSVRNIAGVHVLAVDQLNTYDVLCADDVVFTKAAYDTFLEGPAASVKSYTEIAGKPAGEKPAAKPAAKKAATKDADTKAKDDAAKPAAKGTKAAAKDADAKAATLVDADAKDAKPAKDAKAAKDATGDKDAKAAKDDAAPAELPKGAVAAPADGSAPEGYEVKGNADSGLYHLPGGRWYDATVAEFWFKTEADAQAAGFTKAGARKAKEDDK